MTTVGSRKSICYDLAHNVVFIRRNEDEADMLLPGSMSAQKLFQRNCIVVLRIVRAVYEGYSSVVRGVYDRPPYIRTSPEFSKIAAAKLVPLGGIMAEPLP